MNKPGQGCRLITQLPSPLPPNDKSIFVKGNRGE